MKLLTSTLLLGAATAAIPHEQQVLSDPFAIIGEVQAEPVPEKTTSSWTKPLKDLQHELNHLTDDAKQLWDEMALMFPEEMSKASYWSSPKPHIRKPDSHWDLPHQWQGLSKMCG